MPKRPSLPRPRVRRRRAEDADTQVMTPAPAATSAEPARKTSRRDGARRAAAVLAAIAVGAIGFGLGYLVFDDAEGDAPPAPAAAPAVIVEEPAKPAGDGEEGQEQASAAERIGFPAFATRNTTRVAGADPAADAAGVALASYPSLGDVAGPPVALVAPADSWQTALAAAPLTAAPVAAPVLLSDRDGVPEVTEDALSTLSPGGLDSANGSQVIAVGGVAVPDGLETLKIAGDDPADVAAAVDGERERLTGERHPDHILVVSSDDADAGYSMPAAAWAARSGDPVVFAAGGKVPKATLKVIARHPKAPVFILGPESAISDEAADAIAEKGAKPTRISAEGPVASAIEFARYAQGSFGWNINDPGHGFVVASVDRPADAVAAAPLSSGGKPGPLLVTDRADFVPPELQAYLKDTQPGYEDNPERAVYNHIWLIGDTRAISVAFQAQADDLTKLAPVSEEKSLGATFGPPPGTTEKEAATGGGGASEDR